MVSVSAQAIFPFSIRKLFLATPEYSPPGDGAPPENDRFFGGAFATMTCAVNFAWRLSPDWTLYAAYQQFDIFNSQARRSVRRSGEYWAKCDWPIFRLGARYSF